MAVLNGMYIHVTDESMQKDVDTTSHPVESGIDITDTVRVKPFTLTLSGKIVDYGTMKASQVLSKIKSLQASGSLITYRGRNVCDSMQIQSFESSHPNTNSGGADFSMELRQVRIAKSAYVPKVVAKKQQEKTVKKNPDPVVTLVVGATVVFSGGSVYVSSDAKKPAARRGRSTCKIMRINKASWATHPYNLHSTDGGLVSGWVDKADIEGATATSTSGKTNAGTQQVKSGSGSAVYHTVKSGDNVWTLVNKTYKSLGTTSSWVINNNPSAFSKKGDARTLKVGAKLLMGYKK